MTHRFFLLRKRWLSLLSGMNFKLTIMSQYIFFIDFNACELFFLLPSCSLDHSKKKKKNLALQFIFSPTFHPCFVKMNYLLLWHFTGMKHMWPSTEQCLWSIVRSWMSEHHNLGINGKGAENAVKLQKLKLILLPVKQLSLCIVQHVQHR